MPQSGEVFFRRCHDVSLQVLIYSGRCLFGVTQSEWRDVVYVIIFVGKGGRFKLQSNKDIRFTTLARCLVFFFRARC